MRLPLCGSKAMKSEVAVVRRRRAGRRMRLGVSVRVRVRVRVNESCVRSLRRLCSYDGSTYYGGGHAHSKSCP